jgi:hypothetical protein
MSNDLESLEAQLAEILDKTIELKEIVDNLLYLWDSGELYPDSLEANDVIKELREIIETVDV